MDSTQETRYVAFAGTRKVADGALSDVLPVLKKRFDRNRSELLLTFDQETGRQVDFNLTGTLEQVLERALQVPQRGPGRPKLGVTSREISLLPRHWEWLERQPYGLSGALRRLVEQAMKHEPGKERARQIREAVSNFLGGIAGDRPNYEEATRALFRGDGAQFEALVSRWPQDIRDFAIAKVREAARWEATGPSGA
jgi:hypothetical protein